MCDLINRSKLATGTINRAAAIEVIENELDKIDHVPQWVFNRLTNRLRELPPTQPEIVLCKDCDLWNDWDSAGKDSLGNHVCSCAYWTREDGPVVYTADNDFCSNAERRTDE